jgi:quercetin dioxygenase-like cupin family protein
MGSWTNLRDLNEVGVFPGIVRKTMSYNAETMLCRFVMTKGARVPPHNHKAVQIGYLIKGEVRFSFGDGRTVLLKAGSSYVFDSMETHGAEVLEDSEAIEVFAPMRPEYAV